jgi:hypothetical protein
MPSARSTSDTGTDAYWNSDATERRIQTSYGGFVPDNVIGSEFSRRMRSGMNQFRKLALACCFVLGACSGQFNANSRLRPHRAKAFTGPRKTQNFLIIGGFCSASGGTVGPGCTGRFRCMRKWRSARRRSKRIRPILQEKTSGRSETRSQSRWLHG